MISIFGVWNCKISVFDLWRSTRVFKYFMKPEVKENNFSQFYTSQGGSESHVLENQRTIH